MMANFTQIDFEAFLNGLSPNFRQDQIGMEFMYRAPLKAAPAVQIMVLSSVDVRTKRSRTRGADAIRVQLVHNRSIVGSVGRTNRTPGWEGRLKSKMISLGESIDEHRCPRCNGYLIKRKRKNTSKASMFLGCTNYPLCEYTKNILVK